jgi:hypothetical protein
VMAMVQVQLFSCRLDWGWILASLDFLLLSLCLIVILQAWISIKVSAWSGQNQCCGSGIQCFFGPGIQDRRRHPGSYFQELRQQVFGLKILKNL